MGEREARKVQRVQQDEGEQISNKADFIKVQQELLNRGYDEAGETLRAFTRIVQGYEALEECDDIAGSYRDLAKKAIDELQCAECDAAVSYGKAEELEREFRELEK